jgi:nicotinamidase-related amidase
MTQPWLVVVDMQQVFADPSSEWKTSGFERIVPRVHRLVDHFADRVVFTRFVAPSHPEGAWRAYYERWPWALQPPSAPMYRLAVDPGDHPVLEATTFGKWGDALAHLTGKADGLVLAGVSTDCCVLSTALAAADAGTFVTVAADACAGASPADHQRALDAMALYSPLIRMATVAEIIKP